MNHKKKVFPNVPLMVKGKPRKQRPKMKETPTVIKEIKERPPTRRNPNDVLSTDKTRNTPISKGSKHSPLAKYKTTSLGLQSPVEKSMSNLEQHEYLQFSLHITEEIIRNDMFKNEEMIQVLKQHYQANKSRLDQEKLLKTIAELCSELNIPLDDNMLLFLDDRGSYSRVCCTPPESPFSFDSNFTTPHQQNGGQPTPQDLIAEYINKTNQKQQQEVQQNGQNQHNQQIQSTDDRLLMLAQPYTIRTSCDHSETYNSLHLQPVQSDDATSKQQFTTDVLIDGLSASKIHGNGINVNFKDLNIKDNKTDSQNDDQNKQNVQNSPKHQTSTNQTSTIEIPQGKEKYQIEVIRSPTVLEDLSNAFEFGEETLKAPGEDSIMDLQTMETKLKDLKEFRVLHDATANFVRESDKESDIASTTDSNLRISKVTGVHSDQPVFVMNFKPAPKKQEKNLVIAHYATSVEPAMIQTKEFSVQAALDNDHLQNGGNLLNLQSANVPILNMTTGIGNYINNASTQKNISASDNYQGGGQTNQTLITHNRNQQNDKPCSCSQNGRGQSQGQQIQHLHPDSIVASNINNMGNLTSTDAQYVLLDCPVLIPREHTKSRDFLNAINRNDNRINCNSCNNCTNCTIPYETNYQAFNLRPPPSSNFIPNVSMPNLPTTSTNGNFNSHELNGNLFNRNNHVPERSDLQNSDYYDLTPQKDIFKTSRATNHQNSSQFGCCSCMSSNMATNMAANMPPNKLISDRYERNQLFFQKPDRLDRYKKVNENLSHFYPTIATQVSSMDLLSNDIKLCHGNYHQYNFNKQEKHNQQNQQNLNKNFAMNANNQRSTNYRNMKECSNQNHQCETPKVNNKGDYSTDSNEIDPPIASNQRADVIIHGQIPSYNTFIKTPTKPLSHQQHQQNKSDKPAKVNLDNYRIDSKQNIVPVIHSGQKRPYGDDVSTDRSPGESRGQSPSKSPQRRMKIRQESDDDVSDRTLGIYQSSDSMDKRIISLRHDIEKYSKDDLTTLVRHPSEGIPKRGNDILDILKKNSFNGGVLPTEVALPRQRKMSILRKLSK